MEKKPSAAITFARIVFFFCVIYFFLMGTALISVPHPITRVTGPQSPIILGMIRGVGRTSSPLFWI
jgi:hypothetical protein